MFDNELYEDREFLNTDELVGKSIKYQMLGSVKYKTEQLKLITEDENILDALDAILLVVEDAYNIDLYKFQFKSLSNILFTELKDLEETIEFLEW